MLLLLTELPQVNSIYTYIYCVHVYIHMLCARCVCVYLCDYYTQIFLPSSQELKPCNSGWCAICIGEKNMARTRLEWMQPWIQPCTFVHTRFFLFNILLDLFFYEVCNILSDTLEFTSSSATICKGSNPKCVLRALPNALCQP